MVDVQRTKKDKKDKEEKAPERTKKTTLEIKEVIQEEQEVVFIKRGSGRMVLNNRIIKPNERFSAKPSSIPKVFLDLVERVYDIPAKPQASPVKESKFRIVLTEGSDINEEVKSQIASLEEYDFTEDENLIELRQSLTDNGNEALADLDKDLMKDTILKTLESKYEYSIVNAKGKVQNQKPLSLVEAEKLITVL